MAVTLIALAVTVALLVPAVLPGPPAAVERAEAATALPAEAVPVGALGATTLAMGLTVVLAFKGRRRSRARRVARDGSGRG